MLHHPKRQASSSCMCSALTASPHLCQVRVDCQRHDGGEQMLRPAAGRRGGACRHALAIARRCRHCITSGRVQLCSICCCSCSRLVVAQQGCQLQHSAAVGERRCSHHMPHAAAELLRLLLLLGSCTCCAWLLLLLACACCTPCPIAPAAAAQCMAGEMHVSHQLTLTATPSIIMQQGNDCMIAPVQQPPDAQLLLLALPTARRRASVGVVGTGLLQLRQRLLQHLRRQRCAPGTRPPRRSVVSVRWQRTAGWQRGARACWCSRNQARCSASPCWPSSM